LAFREIFMNFEQGSILDGTFTPVNGKLKLLGEFGRCFILRLDRLRNGSINSNSRSLSSNSRNDSLLNFRNNICWRCKTVLKFTASLRVTWCLFHQGGSSLDLSIQG
jgi:hypothetical protein